MEKLIIGLLSFTGLSFVYLMFVKYKLNKMNEDMTGARDRINQLQHKLKTALDQYSSKDLSNDLPRLRYLMGMISMDQLEKMTKDLVSNSSKIDSVIETASQSAKNAEESLNKVKENSKIGDYLTELQDKKSHYLRLMDEKKAFFLNWVESLKVKNASKWAEFLRLEEEARLAELRRIEEARQKKLREEEEERIRRKKRQEEEEEERRRRNSYSSSSSSSWSSSDDSSSSSSSWGGGDGGGFSGGGSSDSF